MQHTIIRRVSTASAGVMLASLLASQALAFWGAEMAGSGSASCDSCVQAPCQSPADGCARQGGLSGECYRHLEHGRQANAMWPYPYICPDRVWAHAPFDVMENNGWRRQNLLGPHHFDPQTGQLTRAGELRVQWILTQTPPHRRQVWVEQSMDSDIDAARVATAQEFANGLRSGVGEALVQETHIRSPRRPASMVDAERSSFIESRLPAVLPTGSSSTAAGSN